MRLRNKNLRYFLVEKRFRVFFRMFLFILLFMAFLVKYVDIKKHQIIQADEEYSEIIRIPDLEKILEEKLRARRKAVEPVIEEMAVIESDPEPVVESAPQPLPEFQGAIIMDGAPIAVLDGQQYQTGDLIGNFLIIEVTLKCVDLKNIMTQELNSLCLPQYDKPELFEMYQESVAQE